MSGARTIYQMARADFLERVRRYSFLVTLAFSVYVGLATATGKLLLRLGEYRGVLNSAWIGSLMALVSCMLLSLVGFYIVRNAVARDQQTRVGRILAATPMTRTAYTFSKSLSHFAVLTTMVAVMAIAALAFQLARGESHIELWQLLSPFLLVALPAMAMTAAVAILFETTPVLRTGAGNVIYPLAWSMAIAVVQFGHIDPTGIGVLFEQMTAAVRATDPTFKQSFSLQLNIGQAMPAKTFIWSGVNWNAALVGERLLWIFVAIALTMLAAVMFDRFDPAREPLRIRERRGSDAPSEDDPAFVSNVEAHLSPLPAASNDWRLAQLFMSELRLLLAGKRWWWYAITLGFVIAGFAAPLQVARFGVLLAAWLWPVLLWSQLGAREELFSTRALIFSSAHAIGRQLCAAWLSGVFIPLLLSAGVLVRLALRGDWAGASAIVAGSLFVPALALASGAMTGNGRLFEATYTVWWYIGPAHATHNLDFIGVSSASCSPIFYSAAAALAVATAFAARRFRLAA